MTRLKDITNERLVAIFDLLYQEDATFESFLQDHYGNAKDARKDILLQIKQGLKSVGYDGDPNNSEFIFWFCKGLTNPAPRPKALKNYDPLDDKLFEKIKKIMFKKFARDDSEVVHKIYKERISYKKFYPLQNSREQTRRVNKIVEDLKKTPSDWQIDFDLLNDEGKKLLFPHLKKFMEETVSNYATTNQYKIQFNVGGEWHSKPLTVEVYNKLMDNFTEENFIFDLRDTKPEYFYEKGSMDLPEWSLFSSLKFSVLTSIDGNGRKMPGFFKYLIKDDVPDIIKNYLSKLQIFDKLVNQYGKQRPELGDCCFVYALQQTNCYDEDFLNQLRLRIQNRYLTPGNINKLCEEFKIHIKLVYIDDNSSGINKKQVQQIQKNRKRKSYIGIQNAEPNRTHKFVIFDQHYFIEEKTPFTTYYIKNWKTINDTSKYNREPRTSNGKMHWTKGITFISSSNLIRNLFQQDCFKPITYGECSILNTIFYNDVNSNINNIKLEFDENFCTKLIEPRIFKQPKTKRKNDPTYWYADFEADTSGEIHKAFMVVVQNRDGSITKEFRGERCNKQLLDYLPTEAIIYFHNLAYDIRFLASYGISKSIIKGTRTMMTDIKYEGKILHFKDSLPILSCKLSDLPKMFNIENIQKEIFPYKYYTYERLSKNYGEIKIAGQNEDKPWTDSDYQLFESNIDKIKGCRIDAEHFDMWKYCSFYCTQDVNILRIGFNEFRDGFLKDFQIDPYRFISISSLANEVFNQRVYYGKDLFKVGGVVRKFCSHAVYGGRCMTAYNRKWHTNTPLCDFDAVSLYPSAMARLYVVKGKPSVIPKDHLNLDFLSKQGAYIVEIKILKVNKHYAFPLIVKKTKDGNLNDDNLAEGETISMIVDNITLEDLIEFQKIEFELIRGYYWDGERDYTIQEEIRKIFQKRLDYKKQKNPLQQLYKLIMNSCYGKTIERPIEKDFKYLHEGDELDKYWKKNYNKIIDDIKIDNGIHAIKVLKPIDKHFNFSLLGIQVLSMSKRIMNEVMCLAFDLKCHIYYQDTDSMHIEKDDLPRLAKAFQEKYGRELIGSNMGQFHSDFPNIKDHEEMPVAIESYFLMKKMYIDKLQDSTMDIDYMIRGKGLTLNSINYLAKEKFDNDVMKLYEALYNGSTETFDLTKGQPCFQLNKNMTVSTLEAFKRKIKTNYEIGEIKKYFEY